MGFLTDSALSLRSGEGERTVILLWFHSATHLIGLSPFLVRTLMEKMVPFRQENTRRETLPHSMYTVMTERCRISMNNQKTSSPRYSLHPSHKRVITYIKT